MRVEAEEVDGYDINFTFVDENEYKFEKHAYGRTYEECLEELIKLLIGALYPPNVTCIIRYINRDGNITLTLTACKLLIYKSKKFCLGNTIVLVQDLRKTSQYNIIRDIKKHPYYIKKAIESKLELERCKKEEKERKIQEKERRAKEREEYKKQQEEDEKVLFKKLLRKYGSKVEKT